MTKLFWSKETSTSNMSFLDLLTTPSKRARVLPTDTEESAWRRLSLPPLDTIYRESQALCSCRESSEMPFRFISRTEDTTAGPEMTSLLLRLATICTPNELIFC